jgi:aerobic carbon-monoxide dehydrogenase large subunit
MIGESPRRREDLRFITGRGLYVEDIQLPGMLHVAFLRSHYAHARIAAVRSDQARKIPGVVAVITADEMPELRGAVPDLHEAGTLHNPYCDLNIVPTQIMFPQVVKYVGEHFAAVVATSAYAAADGLEAVEVDYDPLPIVHDWERAMREPLPGCMRATETSSLISPTILAGSTKLSQMQRSYSGSASARRV